MTLFFSTMKKLILLLAIFLVITGCTNSSGSYEQNVIREEDNDASKCANACGDQYDLGECRGLDGDVDNGSDCDYLKCFDNCLN